MLPDCLPAPTAACALPPATVAACAGGEGCLLDSWLDAGLSAANEDCRLDAMLAHVLDELRVRPGCWSSVNDTPLQLIPLGDRRVG